METRPFSEDASGLYSRSKSQKGSARAPESGFVNSLRSQSQEAKRGVSGSVREITVRQGGLSGSPVSGGTGRLSNVSKGEGTGRLSNVSASGRVRSGGFQH